MTTPNVACTNCGQPYPPDDVPYLCRECGGIYDYCTSFVYDPKKVEAAQPGIWKYRHTFNLPDRVEPVSLGEGSTPLIWTEVFGRKIAFKCEFLNPSGSFKDRGSSLIAAFLKARAVTEAVEDSSGNAGASFSAYSARAGIKTSIYVPANASGPKRRQIEAYGAELVPIRGSRSDVTKAVRNIANSGCAYASHAYLPFNLPGYATTAYEIFDQLGEMPGAVITPVGQGGLLLGLSRGFNALRIAYHFDYTPTLVGVQAKACAPLWHAFSTGSEIQELISKEKTLAEGVRVNHPLRGDAVLQAVATSQGTIYITDEAEILEAREILARLGFYVEPTSAIVWPALKKKIKELADPVVVILTGSGLKFE
jgi:threonine synthase